MSRSFSRNALDFINDKADGKVVAILCVIDHPDLTEPLRISNDATERLGVQPAVYGTRSTFLSPDGKKKPFYFIGMQVDLPDDQEDADPTATLLLNIHDSGIVDMLIKTNTKATCQLAVVLADTPDFIEFQTGELEIASASGNWAQVRVTFTVEDLSSEPVPWVRFSRQFFPGLHK